MLKKNILILIVFFSLLFSGNIIQLSAANDGGTFGAAFKNAGHAAYFATGKTIISEPFLFLYHSPAGIALSDKKVVSTTYTKLFSDVDGIKQAELSAVLPFKNYAISLNYSALNVDDLRGADNNGLTNLMFDAKFEAVQLSSAKSFFNKDLYFGAQLSYFKTSIERYSLKNYTFGLSSVYIIPNGMLSVLLQNLYSSADSARSIANEKLPINFEISSNYTFFDDLSIGLVINKEKDKSISYRAGVKYNIIKYFSAQAGYISESKQPAVGVSFKIKNLATHYALLKHKDLDLSHKISVDFSF